MFTGLFALLAILPFFVGATPVASPITRRIPLTKRSALVDKDGVVDATALQRHLAQVEGKIARGFEAFEKNTGAAHPNAKKLAKRATGKDPLTDDQSELWQGGISVGTPAVSFTVDFDTGSSDLFLPGPKCGSTCAGHKIYQTASSSTAKDLRKTFSLAFGDGSTVQGEQFSDTVSVAGLKATAQTVGAASQYSTGFEIAEFPPDGLMGMAFPQISVFGANPVFQTLVADGVTTASQFAFKLATSGSELFLGGVDTALFTGAFTQVPVTTEGFWQINLQDVNVNGAAAASGLTAIVDTGTTLIIGDQTNVAKVYAKIPGSKDASATVGAGFFTVPCNAIPPLSVTLGGTQFAISPTAFNLGQVSAGSADCVGGIAGSTGESFWILGDVFLTGVYTSFDVGKVQVGFAKLA